MNYMAIIAVVALRQVLGFLWYSPFLFLQAWKESVGLDEGDFSLNATPFIADIFGSFFMAYVLSLMVEKFHCKTIEDGAKLGVMVWLGFIGPILASHYLFIGFEFDAIAIDAGKELIGLVLSGVILSVWRKK